LQVNLAGFNIDIDQIEKFSNKLKLAKTRKDIIKYFNKIQFTPETISAAYARISRSKKSVDQLRKASLKDIEKARKSNEKIVFGMGHSSIAEHAVFNLDIIGISRYLMEYVQRSRLASYTEKSQRYVTLQGDFVVPNKLDNERTLKKEYLKTIKFQNDAYLELYQNLQDYFYSHSEVGLEDKRNKNELAKQDARYVLSLATKTQMGMTINARSIERLLKRLYSLGFEEANELADKIFKLVTSYAPSLIKFVKPSRYDKNLYHKGEIGSDENNSEVELREFSHLSGNSRAGTKDIDDTIIAAIILQKKGVNFGEAKRMVLQMSKGKKIELVKEELSGIKVWDALPRAFEFGEFTFQLKISASCFAQLKRHRMSSIISSDYSPVYGYTLPSTINNSGNEKIFKKVIDYSKKCYLQIKKTIQK